MAQTVNCLLYVHEDLLSIPSTHIKVGTVTHLSSQGGGGGNREIPGTCWPDCLAESVNPRYSERIIEKDTRHQLLVFPHSFIPMIVHI